MLTTSTYYSIQQVRFGEKQSHNFLCNFIPKYDPKKTDMGDCFEQEEYIVLWLLSTKGELSTTKSYQKMVTSQNTIPLAHKLAGTILLIVAKQKLCKQYFLLNQLFEIEPRLPINQPPPLSHLPLFLETWQL